MISALVQNVVEGEKDEVETVLPQKSDHATGNVGHVSMIDRPWPSQPTLRGGAWQCCMEKEQRPIWYHSLNEPLQYSVQIYHLSFHPTPFATPFDLLISVCHLS